jgi:hypothetical protein
MDWPFEDPPNVAVLSSKEVVDDGKWIHYVYHDEDDGTWQFHSIGGAPSLEEDARLVGLNTIFKLDPTIATLADLPLGWCATREAPDAEWIRQPIDPADC